MAAVIAFPKQEHKYQRNVEFYGPTQVIIFTGVRHERLGETVEITQPSRRRLPSRRNQATAEELE
jgi:hypothetical protein